MSLEAHVTLHGLDAPSVGRDRIQLLEAVAREGSITAGARAVGITYKAAWDALDAMANLFGQPLLLKRAGGKAGGGATLTGTGLRLIDAFHRMEAEMARVLRALEPELAGTDVTPLDLMAGLLMKTSARNALRGVVTNIISDEVSADVSVEVSPGIIVHALVTAGSLRDLGLVAGRRVVVLIKASFVMIASGDCTTRISAQNKISGRVSRCETSATSAEVSLDIGGGKSLVAAITAQGARDLGLKPGTSACAIFDASYVILAID
ncbi:MAG: transcriptional regulator, ModE family [Hyphomicrobiales bacterium]|nr:transcriptional regulator, ModE family [Hyphomicrobiales bacterium]